MTTQGALRMPVAEPPFLNSKSATVYTYVLFCALELLVWKGYVCLVMSCIREVLHNISRSGVIHLASDKCILICEAYAFIDQ